MPTLKYDCALGVMTVTDSKGTYTVRANSGQGSCLNNPECRKRSWQGPIPTGMYFIFRSEISHPSLIWNLGRNIIRKWGDWRIPLRNIGGGPPLYGRDGFYLHGGDINNGSAGCINIGGGVLGDATTDRVKKSLEETEWSVLWVQ